MSRHFRRSYLKTNKVSKSKGTRKVECAYHFRKCADANYTKIIKLSPRLPKLRLLLKLARFFSETPCS